jgi:L-ascorbate metabolism protein UlaG (beta-lactamase superfamily)
MKMVPALACSFLAIAAFVPSSALAAAPIAARTQIFPTSAGKVKITPLYHGSVRIEAGGKVIYLDPAKPFDFKKASKADLIRLTDIDEEHMDPAAVGVLSNPGTEIISPAAAVKTFPEAWPMSNGENKTWHGWTIEAVPNYNLESNHPNANFLREKSLHEKGRANGYVLSYGDERFYFSGASDDVPEVRGLKNIDVAFACMNVDTASTRMKASPNFYPTSVAWAALVFRPKIVIPYQYNDSDLVQLQEQMDGTGVEVRALEGHSQ